MCSAVHHAALDRPDERSVLRISRMLNLTPVKFSYSDAVSEASNLLNVYIQSACSLANNTHVNGVHPATCALAISIQVSANVHL